MGCILAVPDDVNEQKETLVFDFRPVVLLRTLQSDFRRKKTEAASLGIYKRIFTKRYI